MTNREEKAEVGVTEKGNAISPASMEAASCEVQSEKGGSGHHGGEGEHDGIDEDPIEGGEEGAGETPDLTT